MEFRHLFTDEPWARLWVRHAQVSLWGILGLAIIHSAMSVIPLSENPSFASISPMAAERGVLTMGGAAGIGAGGGGGLGGCMADTVPHTALASTNTAVFIDSAINTIPSPAEMCHMLQHSLPVIEVPALLAHLQVCVCAVLVSGLSSCKIV